MRCQAIFGCGRPFFQFFTSLWIGYFVFLHDLRVRTGMGKSLRTIELHRTAPMQGKTAYSRAFIACCKVLWCPRKEHDKSRTRQLYRCAYAVHHVFRHGLRLLFGPLWRFLKMMNDEQGVGHCKRQGKHEGGARDDGREGVNRRGRRGRGGGARGWRRRRFGWGSRQGAKAQRAPRKRREAAARVVKC